MADFDTDVDFKIWAVKGMLTLMAWMLAVLVPLTPVISPIDRLEQLGFCAIAGLFIASICY